MKHLAGISFIVSLCFFCVVGYPAHAQKNEPQTSTVIDSTITLSSLPDRVLRSITRKQAALSSAVDRQTDKLLGRMMKKEAKLQNKLQELDSSKAQALFAASQDRYQQLQKKMHAQLDGNAASQMNDYLPGLDSLKTSLQFMSKLNSSLPTEKLAKVGEATVKLQQLQGKMQAANEVQAFIKEREQQLKDQLSGYGLGKQLLSINKEVYYYQQQMKEYKELINNPDKLAETVIAKLRGLPAFQSFWQRNSMLAQLFPTPQNYGTPAALAGLQTRDQVSNIISQRLPGAINADGSGSNYLQQQLQSAQSQMNAIKDKLNQLGGGSSDMTMPDFKPNSQKTKSFFKRLEYGFNIQNNQSTNLLPTISDIGLTLGYKLSDKAVMGIGTSYKLGLGRGLNHVAFSSQGVSMRSYMDIKAKGSIWITGGYEYNYMQQFSKLQDLRTNVDVWQRSALIGMTKKYKIGKNKQGNMQLLYDFLYKQETPRGTALKFRIGYSFQ